MNNAIRQFRIYQLELSSFCNMSCSYCPHPTMVRPKGFMSEKVLMACINTAVRAGATHLVLHHFGEPLMHPELLDRLKLIADAGLSIQFSTNTILLEKVWNTLVLCDAPITVMIAFHKWVNEPVSVYNSAIEHLVMKASGTNLTIVPAYSYKNHTYEIHRWAKGDTDSWDVNQCPFVKYNLAVVLWNGDIAACCVDHEGKTVTYNILDDASVKHMTQTWAACASCDVGRIMKSETY
jgi:organic radical activating enzyme